MITLIIQHTDGNNQSSVAEWASRCTALCDDGYDDDDDAATAAAADQKGRNNAHNSSLLFPAVVVVVVTVLQEKRELISPADVSRIIYNYRAFHSFILYLDVI